MIEFHQEWDCVAIFEMDTLFGMAGVKYSTEQGGWIAWAGTMDEEKILLNGPHPTIDAAIAAVEAAVAQADPRLFSTVAKEPA